MHKYIKKQTFLLNKVCFYKVKIVKVIMNVFKIFSWKLFKMFSLCNEYKPFIKMGLKLFPRISLIDSTSQS